MKTLLATLVGLGLLAGTANAQYVRVAPGYGSEICAPDVIHQSQHRVINPRVAVAPQAQQAPVEAPAEAQPEAPAESAPEAPAPQAPLPPK